MPKTGVFSSLFSPQNLSRAWASGPLRRLPPFEPPMTQQSWFSTFSIRDGIVHYHDTGACIRLDAALLRDVLAWLTYYVPIRLNAAVRRLVQPGPRLWFMPKTPPPWYLIWNASAWIGARPAISADKADACFYFEDATWISAGDAALAQYINGRCRDVSKTHVAEVFAKVFGYELLIDPERTKGAVVEKSELNGAHDGVIVNCPTPRKPGRVYQKLIETGSGDLVEDLRTPCVGGEPVLVFIKRRRRGHRFANANADVSLADVQSVFSAPELERIRAFVSEMQLDWGGLDILRERHSGRLYIVDVNKTDMPPLKLSFFDKMKASRQLGSALHTLVLAMRERGAA
jgi:hypothetical protein